MASLPRPRERSRAGATRLLRPIGGTPYPGRPWAGGWPSLIETVRPPPVGRHVDSRPVRGPDADVRAAPSRPVGVDEPPARLAGYWTDDRPGGLCGRPPLGAR